MISRAWAPLLAVTVLAGLLTFALLRATTNPADAHCSPEEQCAAGIFCPQDGGRNKVSVGQECRANAHRKGFERRCQSGRGAGFELYCPPGATGTPGASPPERPSSDTVR